MGHSASKPVEGDLIKPFAPSPDDNATIWTIRGRQQFLKMEMGGFGLIAKYQDAISSKDSLVVINPVELTEKLIQELQVLQQETKCTIDVVFSAGDWHHKHLISWSNQFPDAKIYVASDRVLKKQPLLKNPIVVDRLLPVIPELKQDFDIVPFLGCKQPPYILGHDSKGSDRVEHVVFHKSTQTLFITDHVFAPSDAAAPSLKCNTAGFSIKVSVKSAESARNVLALEPKRIVFSHGKGDTFSLNDDGGGAKSCVELLEKAYKWHFLK